MKIIFVGGGTSGHINPAINMIFYIKKIEPNAEILYVGSKNSLEEILTKKNDIEFKSINTSGFSRKISLNSFYKNFISFIKIFISDYESKKILKIFKPDICFGTGGYVCGSFLRRTYKMNIPFILHEQNSVPGLTTRLLAKKASKILLAMPDAKKYFNNFNFKTEIVGNPINVVIKIDKKKAIDMINEKYNKKFDNNKKIILSFGGSLGSDVINEMILEFFKKESFFHIHAYGKNSKAFLKKLNKANVNFKNLIVREYIDDMNICMLASDLIICRSGSMTLSEIALYNKPSILIPSPNVTDNHQYFNANFWLKQGAASMIEEKYLNFSKLRSEIYKILNDNKVTKEYCKNIKKFFIPNTNEKIYKIIKTHIDKS